MRWSDISSTVGQVSSTDIQQAIIDQAILTNGELGWWHAFQRQADILNICFNVLVLHCLSELFATMFYLNVRDNDGVQAYKT